MNQKLTFSQQRKNFWELRVFWKSSSSMNWMHCYKFGCSLISSEYEHNFRRTYPLQWFFTGSQRLWYTKCALYHKYFLCFVKKSPVLSVCMSLPLSQLFVSSAAVSALGTNRFGHACEWHGLLLSVLQAGIVEVSPFSAWVLFSGFFSQADCWNVLMRLQII